MRFLGKIASRYASLALSALFAVTGCKPSADGSGSNPATATATTSVTNASVDRQAISNFPPANTATAPLPKAGLNEPAAEHLRLADELLARGKTNDTLLLLEKVAKEYPDEEEGHFLRGFLLGQLGRNVEAIQCYEAALRVVPDYAEAHSNLGNLLVKEGRFEVAIPHFEAAIAQNPENPNFYNNLGTAYARLGRLPEAIPQFNRAVQINAEYADAWFNLGRSYSQTGKFREAVQPLQTALSLKPNLIPARKLLVEVQRMLASPRPQ